MSHFIYAIINFVLLIFLLWLVARKAIGKIFAKRRDRIDRDMDEAEALEAIPDFQAPEAAETAAPAEDFAALTELREQSEEEQNKLRLRYAHEKKNLYADALDDIRYRFADQLKDAAVSRILTEENRTRLSERTKTLAAQVLETLSLTPGDIAYLKTNDTLEVALSSAEPMSDALVRAFREKSESLLAVAGGKVDFRYEQNTDLLAGFRFRLGDTVYDGSLAAALDRAVRAVRELPLEGTEDAETFLSLVRKELSSLDLSLYRFQQGRVLSVSDGICWLDGLADIMYSELVEFECGTLGMVLDIQVDKVGCVVFGSYEGIESGSRVTRVGRIASVPVGEALLGRVVSPFGKALDGRGRLQTTELRPIEYPSPAIPDRGSVSRPLHTGLKAIDSLVPIGRGQRELLIGDRQTGKTSIVVDTILNQKGKNTYCVYVAIGQKDTTIANIREKLEAYGAMAYTTIVAAPASDSAASLYIAPYAGTAIAEYFMYSGRDALVIYDDLSKHAVAYRELSLLLHRPSGREAYPGDVFYLHSRLLERSAQLSEAMGGGSMTALPIIETQAGDISAYIPTNVISITDGQIFLETDLFNEGQRPAVNVGLSVSRVGGAAQTKLMKTCSASLRMRLAQYRELATFAQFDTDLDAATRKTLSDGARMMAALRQPCYAPLPDWKQALLLFAVSDGLADAYTPEDMAVFEAELYRSLDGLDAELQNRLRSGSALSDEDKELLRTRIRKDCAGGTLNGQSA